MGIYANVVRHRKKYKKQTMIWAIFGFRKKAQVQQEASGPSSPPAQGALRRGRVLTRNRRPPEPCGCQALGPGGHWRPEWPSRWAGPAPSRARGRRGLQRTPSILHPSPGVHFWPGFPLCPSACPPRPTFLLVCPKRPGSVSLWVQGLGEGTERGVVFSL